MKLYRAQLYVVKDEVDYFKQKQFNAVDCYDQNNTPIYKTIETEIGLGRHTSNSIFQHAASYFNDDRYNFNLIVTKQFPNRVKDITTDLVFPIIKAINPSSYGCCQLEKIRVFEVNQRLYTKIIGEMKIDEVDRFVNRLTKEELENRKQLLLYAIEQAQKHWNPIPSAKVRIKYSSFYKQLGYKKEKLEEEMEVRQYVKKIEQMRNSD